MQFIFVLQEGIFHPTLCVTAFTLVLLQDGITVDPGFPLLNLEIWLTFWQGSMFHSF